MTVDLGSAHGRIEIDTSQVQTGMAQARSQVSSFESAFSSIGRSLTAVGAGLTAGVTLPLVTMGRKAVGVASSFESSMNVLGIAAGDAGASMEDLRAAALAVGADVELVGIDASESAEAMTNLYKAGLDTTDIFGDLDGYLEGTTGLMGALRASIDLAAASDLDLNRASDAVAIAMATFGLEAAEATHIADSFVQAADASVTEVGELADALTNVGPTAASFGWSLDQTNTALALLSERGIRGAEAGTALKSMMTNMMRTTKDVTATWNALGISMYTADGTMRALPDIIGDLETAMAGMTQEQRNMTVQTLAGTYGMKALQTLLDEGAEGWTDMSGAIATAASASEVAGVRTQGFAASMEQLQGTLETLLIQVGTPLIQDFLTPLVQKITDVIGKITEVNPAFFKWAGIIGLVVAALGPLLTGLGLALTVIPALISPIGLVVAGLAALGVAFATNFMGIRDAMRPVMEMFVTVGAGAQSLFSSLTGGAGSASAFSSVFGAIADALGAGMAESLDLFMRSMGEIPGLLEQVSETVRAAFLGIVEIAMASWPQVQAIIETVWAGISAAIQFVLDTVVPLVIGVFQTVVGWFDENMPRILEVVNTVWQGILRVIQWVVNTIVPFIVSQFDSVRAWVQANWPLIQSTIETVLNAILAVVEGTLGAIQAFWAQHGERIMAIVNSAWTIIKTVIETTINTVMSIIRAVMLIIQGDWEGAWEEIKETAGRLWEAIKTIVVEAMNVVYETISIIWLEIKEKVEAAWESIRTKTREVWDWIKEKVEGVINRIKSAVLNVFGSNGVLVSAVRDAYEAVKRWLQPIIDWFGDLLGTISGAAAAIGRLVSAILNLAGVELPSWLPGGSPPPMAVWLDTISESAALARDALSDVGSSLASIRMSGGGLGTLSAQYAPQPVAAAAAGAQVWNRGVNVYGGLYVTAEGGMGGVIEELYEVGL